MTAQVPEFMGCLWPVDPACLSDEWEALDEQVKERSLALASSTLTRLTGGRVSNCPVEVRPSPQDSLCWAISPIQAFRPGLDISGNYVNNCSAVRWRQGEVALPPPAGRLDAVTVDGQAVDLADVRLDNNLLIWQGQGEAPWPTSQDMSLPNGAEGTFSVTYLNAYPPDSLAAYAAGILAREYAKACTSGKCRLPSNVTTVVRQGVTLELTTGAFPGGLTGLREVDAFISLWNPSALTQATRVWTPDIHRARRVG